MSRALRGRRRTRRGFTIIELMVSVVITAIVVTALYSISRSATATFNQQQRTAEMQLRLRFAMEQLRADVSRAGFMASPNTNGDFRVCPRPSSPFQAVQFAADPGAPIPNPSDNLNVPIKLDLIGNFATQDEYLVSAVTGSTIYLQNQTPQWARIPNVAEFNRIFIPPSGATRMIRITSTNGQTQFLQVTSGTYVDSTSGSLPSLTVLTPPVLIGDTPSGGSSGGLGCGLTGMGVGSTVAPVSMVEYAIANLSATQAQAYPDDSTLVPLKTDLVRREFNLTPAAAIVPGSERIVGEYAVDFNAGIAVDDAMGVGTGAIIHSLPFNSSSLAAYVGPSAPSAQRVRALTVRLSIRERDQDPSFGWVPGIAGTTLTRFRVRPAPWPGAARVRTLVTDIALPNLAIRNLR